MTEMITLLSTNLFRAYVIKRFMWTLFTKEAKNRMWERISYVFFFVSTAVIYELFHYPPFTILMNIIAICGIAQMYEGSQGKKLLVSFLIYGTNMICDVISVYSLSNYVVGGDYSEIASYVTVLLTCICEVIVEKCLVREKENMFILPCWKLLLVIPVISMFLLVLLIMNNLNNRIILISVSVGLLFINLLIFYLYDTLLSVYNKMKENSLFEQQAMAYAAELDILAQSEEKVNALQHDMKHHLNEIMIMAKEGSNDAIVNYMKSMKEYMSHPSEFVRSGNKEVDGLLNYMIGKAKESLKCVEYKVCVPAGLRIDIFDLNVLLGNLLDNAIFAAENSAEKSLRIMIHYKKGMLFIEIQNSFDHILKIRHGEFLSTKENCEEHGIGLQNVKRVVGKYNGTMEIRDKNHIFFVRVSLYTDMV